MKILARIARLAVILAAATGFAYAQPVELAAAPAYAPASSLYSDAELDQMLAPIALYPDEVLAQILMAATYPLEVVEAARWSRANAGLRGEEAVAQADDRDWDPSVKSLVAFPEVLAMMDERLEWTQALGEAFLGQRDAAMRSVQRLRRAASDAGNLPSSDEMVVSRDGDAIALDSPSPEIVYVPYYDPRVVYGPWWWPDYPPVYWSPWPNYLVYGGGFAWGLGIPLGVNFFFGDFDWRHRSVRLQDHRPFYYHGRDHRPIVTPGREWRHDPNHRRGVPYRNPVARRDFATPRAPGDVRRDDRSRIRPRPDGGANPVTRPGPQQGFFPPRTDRPEARTVRPTTPGGALPGAAPNVIARPPARAPQAPNAPVYGPQRAPANAPQVVRPPVNPQPLARPMPSVPQGVRSAPALPQQPIARPAPSAPSAPSAQRPSSDDAPGGGRRER